jgi:prepilin-type N-terminal cleavage/methylation domain-containing protein
MRSRTGFTLIELLATMALLVVLFSIAALSLAPLFTSPVGRETVAGLVDSQRERAIDSGERVVVLVEDSGGVVVPLLLFPDGRAVGTGLDPLVGEVLGP